jgi:excisionase family DNA binding protein
MTGSLLTADDVAAMLGMGTDWVYAQVRAGRIPHVRLGRYVRFREESIEAWIREMEHRATMNGGERRRGAAGTAPGMAEEM